MLIVALVYGFIGSPVMQARQEIEDIILVRNIGLVNDYGDIVMSITTNVDDGGSIYFFDKNGDLGILLSADQKNNSIYLQNNNLSIGADLSASDGGTMILFDKFGQNPKVYSHN